MGEALLAAYLQTVLDKLDSRQLMNFARQEGFESELRKWKKMLRKIMLVLGDADEKQLSSKEVKKWLDDLLDLAYDADDVLDEIDCEALKRQNNSSSDPETSSRQVQDILAQIKEITTRVQDIEGEKTDLELKANHGIRSSIINNRTPTTSLLDSSEVVGREQDVVEILKLMGLSETTEAKVHANPVFGMGGFGSDLVNLRYLDISDTPCLQELPPHVVDLKFIRKLTKFVVGESDVLQLRELKKLHHLAGSLTISRLDKVKDVEDAIVINLMNKKNVEELNFEWCGNLDNTENVESQVQILNLLEPHKALRKLGIKDYGGLTLPNWIDDSSYSNLVELSLINCKRSKSLPSLGQLPLLENLKINGMLEIESIGTEFYGEASQPFPSLKTLKFKSMPKWVNWSLPVGITSLLHLRIKNCPELVVPILSMFPSLQELRFTDVNNISNGLHCPTSLTEIRIAKCKNLRTLPDGIISSSNSNLQVLEIGFCESLESFPCGVLPSTLKRLSIRNCRKLESISEMLLGPASLDRIEFFEYPNLKSLPECLCTNLTFLYMYRCESIESFPETPNLTGLHISYCKNLKYLPSNLPKLTSLKYLGVVGYQYENVELFDKNFPGHFVAEEGLDQSRARFYTLKLLSTVLLGKPAFRSLICHGLVLAEDSK
ncbi:Rx, N-terminal [Dillenia turbinata]|uniref:Rx, N-terminal n=1 Tax=Dillenia turbinata TaxID=194707 RepID=A0AAN8VPK8_9MAGN